MSFISGIVGDSSVLLKYPLPLFIGYSEGTALALGLNVKKCHGILNLLVVFAHETVWVAHTHPKGDQATAPHIPFNPGHGRLPGSQSFFTLSHTQEDVYTVI